MATNLANVYAALSQRYSGNYAISYRAPPSYLAEIVGAEVSSKIIYFYKENRRKLQDTSLISPSKLKIKSSGNLEDSNLTGSPLKDDCAVDVIDDISLNLEMLTLNPWTVEEEYHLGISVEKARSIINTQEFQLGPTKGIFDGAQGSVWFLCNGVDREMTLFLQYEFSAGYFNRGIAIFKGIYPINTVNAQSLVYHHYKLIRPDARLETFIENTYHIKPNIVLRCSWSTTASLPSLVNLSSCDVILSQNFCTSDCGLITQDLMNQLRILILIREDIISYKEAEAAEIAKEPAYRCGRGIDMDELRDEINKVMTEISGFGEIDTGRGLECDIEASIVRAKQRYLTDLTDKLWEILKCCSSYKDLKMAFNILFQCAAHCNIVNTPTNKTRLAEIITEVANRRLAIPCLTGSEPLELLLEIGMEKLYKDYECIFTDSKICSANSLKVQSFDTERSNGTALLKVRKSLHNAIRSDAATTRKTLLHNNMKSNNKFQHDDLIGFKNSNFNKEESATCLAKLLQIHCTLEHLLMIHINLNLTNIYSDVCEQLLKKPLPIVDSVNEFLIDKMDISLSAHDVRKHLEGKHPNSRRVTMLSKNKFREVKSTFYYSMQNVCPPGVVEGLNIEEMECILDNTYYCWLYRKIKTIHESIKV